MIKLKLDLKKLIGTQVGACFFNPNVSSLPEFTPLAIQLGLQSYYYVDLNAIKDDSQAAIINTFLTATGAKIGVGIKIQNPDYLEYLDWVVKVFGDKLIFIQLGSEYTHLTKEEMVARSINCYNKYPTKTFSWNTGLLTSHDTISTEVNKLIAVQTVPIYLAHQYGHVSDGCPDFTTDQAANLASILNYYKVFLPGIQTAFKTTLPNLKQQCIEEWSIYKNESLVGEAVSNLAIGSEAIFRLENTEGNYALYWQQLPNLIVNGKVTVNYNSIKRIVPAFKFKYSIPVELPFEGTAQGFGDGKSSYGLLINHPVTTEETISVSDIQIGKKKIVGGFVNDFGFADTLDAPIQNSIITETKIPIHKNSTNFITFHANA